MVVCISSSPTLQEREQALVSDPSLQFAHILKLLPFRPALAEALRRRESVLGEATLSCCTLHWLLQQVAINLLPLSWSGWVSWHAPTLTAKDTQDVLPRGVLVQKTVTLELPTGLVVWTGIGNFHLRRRHRHALADALGIFRHLCDDAPLNPATVDPLIELGMVPGMVSPWMDPSRQSRVRTVVWLQETEQEHPQSLVAISLSRYESLLLPASLLPLLLQRYIQTVYPRVRFLAL